MKAPRQYRTLSIPPQQLSSLQVNDQPTSSEQSIPSPESMTDRERTLARVLGRTAWEDRLYRGGNSQVTALINERREYLIKTAGTETLSKENVPSDVTEVFKVKRFRILGIEPETTTHEIPNVRSLELSKKQTQYRLMVQNALYKEFEGTTLRLDAVLYIRRDREQDSELVIFDMDEYDSFRLTLDSEEAADKLMHDVQLLTGTLEENTMRAQRLDAIRKRIPAKDGIA